MHGPKGKMLSARLLRELCVVRGPGIPTPAAGMRGLPVPLPQCPSLWCGRLLAGPKTLNPETLPCLQAAYTYYQSPYPKFLSKLLFFYMITLLALFFNFYRRKHSGGSKGSRKKTQ